jgi:hypothetical protein
MLQLFVQQGFSLSGIICGRRRQVTARDISLESWSYEKNIFFSTYVTLPAHSRKMLPSFFFSAIVEK